jgi:hypothetical protein
MHQTDFNSIFYDISLDERGFMVALDSVLCAENCHATIIPFASAYSPEECFKSAGSRIFDVNHKNSKLDLFKMKFSTKAETSRELIEGQFFVYQYGVNPNLYLAITLECSDFVSRALLPFIEQNRARFYLTFLNQDKLKIFLHNYREGCGYTDLNILRASLISRYANERKETIIPSITWLGLPLDTAFTYANENNGWFKSLTFEALRRDKKFAQITVYRNGVIKTDNDVIGINKYLIESICNLIRDNLALFSKRSRTENQMAVKPLTIQFGQNQFSDVDENAKFIDKMNQLSNASISVIHGNPYIFLSIIDYIDGSTFDVWVLKANELIIVPQLKSSVNALKRIINHIFDRYAEGTIQEFIAEVL